MKLNTHGTCHQLANDQRIMTSYVNGVRSLQLISDKGSCHEAAWQAVVIALRAARMLGAKHIIISNSSRLVANQFDGSWRARNPMMRSLRNLCRRLADGMSVSFQF
ncbi:reverse transcriptase-like protein [Sphingobium yanoikuyae]|uniref:reverse transcriptase-like protein n=1 Tax=Sphingobium yanoikuyae TaxID=13690 RepID=UPI0028AC87AA|nr:reverse transcriptase-like protein [Sphingobium yanoikuyae]